MQKRCFAFVALLWAAVFCAPPAASAPQSVYKNQVKGGMYYYAYTQGFPESHTIWSAIGITSDDVVYIGVSDHAINAGLFKYDSKKDTMTYLGDVLGAGKLWLHQWQGKIHTPIVQNSKDGNMYFGTDAGNGLWESMGMPDHEYEGGHWFSIDTKTDKLTNLGIGTRYLGLKSIAVDPVYGRLFATTDPSSHFVVYDIEKGKSPDFKVYRKANQDLGCINGIHEPRMVWADKWGNAYSVNEVGQLVKFTGATGELTRVNTTLIPYAPATPTWLVGSGASAIVAGPNRDFFYGATYYGRLFKHIPEEKGDGKIIDLGNGLGDDNQFQEKLKVGNLALGHNGKLYFVVGGHGNFITKDSSALLVEFDPEKRTKTPIYKFDHIVTECTGGCTDTKGNIYFAAHGQSVPKPGETALRKPYLVKFHPDKIERMKGL